MMLLHGPGRGRPLRSYSVQALLRRPPFGTPVQVMSYLYPAANPGRSIACALISHHSIVNAWMQPGPSPTLRVSLTLCRVALVSPPLTLRLAIITVKCGKKIFHTPRLLPMMAPGAGYACRSVLKTRPHFSNISFGRWSVWMLRSAGLWCTWTTSPSQAPHLRRFGNARWPSLHGYMQRGS